MPPGVTVIGLGPGDPQLLTREAWQVLAISSEVYLRTVRHEAVSSLPIGPQYISFDASYEDYETLAEVHEHIAQQVLRLGTRDEGVVYAVPGHPLVGDSTVQRIQQLTQENGLPLRLVAGFSLLESSFSALNIDPLAGLQVCDATILAQKFHPNLDPDVPALITQVYNRHLAGELKLTLMNLYPDQHPLQVLYSVGTPQLQVDGLALYQLDRLEKLDHLTSVFIPALSQPGSLASHQNVVAHLRAPEGCPWDREQTHQSLRTSLLEETYEVLDALDADDMGRLREELGDLMLQIMLHAQIATEEGDFKLVETVQANISKLVRRHPHVFGNAVVNDSADVLRSWEQIKRQERGDKQKSLLDGISRALPALLQAMEIQRRVTRVGFDWPNAEQVMDKVLEELDEWRHADDPKSRSSELGDLLFSLVNLARWYELDAESSLRQTNQRFTRRFAYMERQAARKGQALEKLDPLEMDALWEHAKEEEQKDE
ncbi:MAG: bifunctional methyltransferase/pyrophosphohydrolase YabN [Anaerolineae bacterium]